ncbi:unnamed protein product, partial [Urochloa humidicola]
APRLLLQASSICRRHYSPTSLQLPSSPTRPREAETPRPAADMAAVLALAVVFAVASLGAEAVWLEVPQSGTKCVSEEIQPNVVVLADYSIMYESHPYSHPTIAVKVTSPYGNTLHHNENATVSQFAFTTAEAGNYLACFWIDSAEKGSGVSVNL